MDIFFSSFKIITVWCPNNWYIYFSKGWESQRRYRIGWIYFSQVLKDSLLYSVLRTDIYISVKVGCPKCADSLGGLCLKFLEVDSQSIPICLDGCSRFKAMEVNQISRKKNCEKSVLFEFTQRVNSLEEIIFLKIARTKTNTLPFSQHYVYIFKWNYFYIG